MNLNNGKVMTEISNISSVDNVQPIVKRLLSMKDFIYYGHSGRIFKADNTITYLPDTSSNKTLSQVSDILLGSGEVLLLSVVSFAVNNIYILANAVVTNVYFEYMTMNIKKCGQLNVEYSADKTNVLLKITNNSTKTIPVTLSDLRLDYITPFITVN